MLVEGVDGDVDPAGDDLGLEHSGGGALGAVTDLTAEDDLDLIGAAHVEVVGHQRLEEAAGVAGGGEHDGAGGLDLAPGELPPVARPPLPAAPRHPEPGQPPGAEHPDLAWAP